MVFDDLKNLISVNQHGFLKNQSTLTNLLEYATFVLYIIQDGWQIDFVYTNFLKVFDRLRHQLLLEELSVGIAPARCLWLRSYSTRKIQRKRIGDTVFKDIRVTSGVPQGSNVGSLSDMHCVVWIGRIFSICHRMSIYILFCALILL
jgi:hypothetical protein